MTTPPDFAKIAADLEAAVTLPVAAAVRGDWPITIRPATGIPREGSNEAIVAAVNAFAHLLAELERVKGEREAAQPLIEAARSYAVVRRASIRCESDEDPMAAANLAAASAALRAAALALENK